MEIPSNEFGDVPPYDYIAEGEANNVYAFVTISGVFYEVRFKPSGDYISPVYSWRDSLFEIVIDVAYAPNPARIPADRSVLVTIIAIIIEFFAVHERVVLYICDDSDSRQLARKRKFDNWYARFGSADYAKFDLLTPIEAGEPFYASFFYRTDNPYRHEIIKAFEQLASGEK